ncbi:MAG: hypothetical protein Q4G65_04090 [bacterium]|nr:hypothetical protein [bacterium]
MNMKPEFFLALLAMVALTATAQAAQAAEGAPTEAPKVATAVPAKADVQAATGSDVINLDELDDSADAAKKAPAVALAKKATKPVPPSSADVLVDDKKSSSAAQGLFATELARDESALVDISCDDATLADILRQFRRTTGANIISADSSNLNQRVSVTLNHVPWKDALQAILNSKKFRLEPRGDIYFVSEDKVTVPEFTRTFVLNHASATELATLFNTTLGGATLDPKTGKPVVVAGKPAGRQIATAFEGANVVVVTATEKILADCEAIIKAVDKAIPQIYIEARFIEVSNEALHKLGMQWNQLESWGATAHGLEAGWERNAGRAGRYYIGETKDYKETKGADGSTSLQEIITKNYGVPDKIYSASGAGRTAENMSWANARGFSGQLSADDFRLALSAFESMSDVKIFSNPKIIVSNGKEAKVDMTTKFPHVKVTSQRNNTGNESYVDMATEMQAIPGEDKMMFAKEAFFSWGITLDVKPRISPDGLISVEIIPTISQLDKDVTASGFYEITSDAGSGLYPIIQVKRLTTDFTMKDGATAVIGGLSKTTEEDIDSGIPYLRNIPYVGPKLFGWKSRGKVQKEIVVFVTLGIADPADLPADVGLPKNAVTGREYVEGRKLEPGDRAGGVANLMAFDTRPIEEQRKDDHHAPGSVTITPVRKELPVKKVEPVAPAGEAAATSLDELMTPAGGNSAK